MDTVTVVLAFGSAVMFFALAWRTEGASSLRRRYLAIAVMNIALGVWNLFTSDRFTTVNTVIGVPLTILLLVWVARSYAPAARKRDP